MRWPLRYDSSPVNDMLRARLRHNVALLEFSVWTVAKVHRIVTRQNPAVSTEILHLQGWVLVTFGERSDVGG